jgi:hypothetical protein
MVFCCEKIVFDGVFFCLTQNSSKSIVEFVKNKIPATKSSVAETDVLSILKGVRYFYVEVRRNFFTLLVD